MLSEELALALLGRENLTQFQMVLICLASGSIRGKTAAEVRWFAMTAGVRPAWSWDVSSVLGKARGRARRCANGWQLTPAGWHVVRSLAEEHLAETLWRDEEGARASQ